MKFFVNSKPRWHYIYKSRHVGNIDILDGVVDVIDPGYDDIDKYGATIKVKPGSYKCYIDLIDFPYKVMYEDNDYEVKVGNKKPGYTELKHDVCLASVYILHEDYSKFTPKEYWTKIDNIAVDAGVAGFYNHKPDYTTEEDWMAFCGSLTHLEKYPTITCDVNHSGITVSSGDGDGYYNVYSARHAGDIVSLGISFYDS